jgi:hypothetical protein
VNSRPIRIILVLPIPMNIASAWTIVLRIHCLDQDLNRSEHWESPKNLILRLRCLERAKIAVKFTAGRR